MADGITYNFEEMNLLAADIAEAPMAARDNIRKALTVTARNIKDDWRKKLTGSETLPGLVPATAYDVRSSNSSTAPITAEIGIEVGKVQGSLGFISEYGSPTSPPKGYGLASLNENKEDFQRGIEIAIADALRAAGL